jgi:hypothetical protein
MKLLIALVLAGAAVAAQAKLPPPDDASKAKADEAAQRTAWSNAVGNFQLCKSMDKVAQRYRAEAQKSGKPPGEPVPTPPCQDPGPFALKKDTNLPLEASGAHSPARNATAPPSSNATDAQLKGQTKKP